MIASAKSVNFDPSMMWVDMIDGRKLGVPLAYFPRLLSASPQQLSNCEISGGGSGLHWLEDLVSGITNENRHGQVDWGSPVGREEVV